MRVCSEDEARHFPADCSRDRYPGCSCCLNRKQHRLEGRRSLGSPSCLRAALWISDRWGRVLAGIQLSQPCCEMEHFGLAPSHHLPFIRSQAIVFLIGAGQCLPAGIDWSCWSPYKMKEWFSFCPPMWFLSQVTGEVWLVGRRLFASPVVWGAGHLASFPSIAVSGVSLQRQLA